MNYSKTIKNYEELLRLEGKSDNTIEIYSNLILKFIKWTGKDVYHISGELINKYLRFKIIKENLSNSWQNQFINAVKKFYKLILNKKINPKHITRPSKERKLIEVLSIDEVWILIDSIEHVKQKAIIAGIYLHGLRRSEILNLRYEDIEIRQGVYVLCENSKFFINQSLNCLKSHKGNSNYKSYYDHLLEYYKKAKEL